MGEKITGYDGEVIAEIVDYHDSSSKYLGTASVEAKSEESQIVEAKAAIKKAGWLGGEEEKSCLELLLMLWLPIAIMMIEVIRG